MNEQPIQKPSKAAMELWNKLKMCCISPDGTCQDVTAAHLIDDKVEGIVELAKEESTRISEDSGTEYCSECCRSLSSIPKHFTECKVGELLADWDKGDEKKPPD